MGARYVVVLHTMGAETVSASALVRYRQGSSANDSRMLYLHWVSLFPGRWLDEPERAGFLSASCLLLV
jgi:hypothetical protein